MCRHSRLRTLSLGIVTMLSIVLAQCSGSGGNASSTPATAKPTVSPTHVPTPAPTPTPSPTPTPTPTPSPTPTPPPGVISLSPNPAQIPSIPCSGYGTFTATEGGYSGTFTAQPADNLDVGVSGQAIGPGQELFSVNVDYFSGVATTITVTDSNGRSAVETLDVYTCGG